MSYMLASVLKVPRYEEGSGVENEMHIFEETYLNIFPTAIGMMCVEG